MPPESRAPLKLSARNNHLLLRAVVLALLSLRGGNDEAWRASEQLHRRYLSSIDECGVPVEEAVRGASAAWYCNLAVMLMTSYRWIAVRCGRPVDGEERYLAAVAALARVADDPTILHTFRGEICFRIRHTATIRSRSTWGSCAGTIVRATTSPGSRSSSRCSRRPPCRRRSPLLGAARPTTSRGATNSSEASLKR